MNSRLHIKLKTIFKKEKDNYFTLQDLESKWKQLEKLHIIGQLMMSLHLQTHWLMLNLAIEESKPKEILGQILRLILVFPGHLFGRLPIGNVGTTRVSAFRPMEIPPDLKDLFE